MCVGLGINSLAGRQVRVLIVEDEALVADDLADTIEAAGALVIGLAAEKRDAVRLTIDHRPDLVLMDIRLRNGADGIDTAETIRAMTGSPIIFCTGNGDPDTRRRVQAFGNAELLIKPIDYEALIQSIRRICHQHAAPSGTVANAER
jgi:DNA-binding NarL/FixJ family response regulator